jgi:hypothetical protein
MRAKVVVTAAGLALLILAPIVYLRFHSPSPEPSAALAPEVSASSANVPAPVAAPVRRWTPPDRITAQGVPASHDPAADMTAPNHADYVLQRRSELTELGMSDDPAALKTILSELNNQDLQIRQAALSATIQFGSKDALPMLKNELTFTEDAQEKVDIQNAIEYLQLPSASDALTNDSAVVTQQSPDAPSSPRN